MAKASDFKFGIQLGFAKPIIKSDPEEKWGWPWASQAPQNFRFLYNISATAMNSDFKFGKPLEFAKSHHKITRREKVGVALG